MALLKARTSFVTSLRESLQEKSEATMSAEAGLTKFNRVEPALQIAGLENIKCLEWKKDKAVFQGKLSDQDVMIVCTDNGDSVKIGGLLDVEDDGDFIPVEDDIIKWEDDLIKFFKKFLFKIVRAK